MLLPSVEELLSQAREGDRQAVDALLRRCEARILRLARAEMGPALRERVASRDLLQDGLMGLARALPRAALRDEASLLRYAATILRRRAVDQLRRHHEAHLPSGVPLAAAGPGPSTVSVRREEDDRLHAALAALPADERAAVELRDIEGLSFEDVAARLGRPTARAARELHWRALRRLSARLGARPDRRAGAAGG